MTFSNVSFGSKTLLAIAALTTSSIVNATLINGDFEDGLAGWSTVGATATRGTVGPYAPTIGVSQAAMQSLVVTSEPPFGSDEEIAEALGLPSQANESFFETIREDFEGDNDGRGPLGECEDDDCYVGGGAAIYQTFEAKAGQSIEFNFNFLIGDIFDAAYAVLVSDTMINSLLLADTAAYFNPGGDPLPIGVAQTFENVSPAVATVCGNGLSLSPLCADTFDLGIDPLFAPLEVSTGYHSASIDIKESGMVTLGFVLLNESFDGKGETGLLIDNVTVTSVSEPHGTLGLLFLGLVCAALAKLRKPQGCCIKGC